jgi:hypothetical protein
MSDSSSWCRLSLSNPDLRGQILVPVAAKGLVHTELLSRKLKSRASSGEAAAYHCHQLLIGIGSAKCPELSAASRTASSKALPLQRLERPHALDRFRRAWCPQIRPPRRLCLQISYISRISPKLASPCRSLLWSLNPGDA